MDYETHDKLPVSVKWKIHDIVPSARNVHGEINCFLDILLITFRETHVFILIRALSENSRR